MQKHVLVLTTSAFILAWGASAASAQQVPMTQQQPQILQQQSASYRAPKPRAAALKMISRKRDGLGLWPWLEAPPGLGRGAMGPGMMRRVGLMGPGSMGRGMMMRMMFSLMDSDGDGTISLQEFQAAHERIFKGMDANKDGRLTLDEIQAFMQGTRRAIPRQ
jgi:EF hand domain-containing protein